MNKYSAIYTFFLLMIFATDFANATQGRPTAFLDNTVCMSLPVYILSLLLPARDIVEGLADFLPSIASKTEGDESDSE